MPVYEYNCSDCGSFAQLRSITESSTTASCPECGAICAKVFPIVNLRQMRPENRVAWERNERSAHAPHVCGSGCSHPRKAKVSRNGKPALEASKKRYSRPWMLGH